MVEIHTANIGRRISHARDVILDALLPPQCLCCGTMVDRQGNLCAPCWSDIRFLQPPCCHACGLPFPHDEGEAAMCAACIRQPPDFDRARSVLAYDDHSRALILRLKHGDRLDGAPAFGQWLARAGSDLLDGADLLLPVPLHRWRLLRRRYNQAALLSLALSRHCGVPSDPRLLRRQRSTASQGGQSRAGRARNVRGAFAVAQADRARLQGSHVVLIDDVLTTGATVSACARLLKRHGAARVDVLTLARVL